MSLASKRLAESKILPTFVVVGAQKAGSTFILENLRLHPEIFMPREEVSFFEDSVFEQKSMRDFENHFVTAEPHQKVGFKRPNLLACHEAPMRMQRVLGENTKFVAILRNPVTRAISAYFHSMATGLIPVQQVDLGLSQLLAGELTEHPRAQQILEFGKYAPGLERYSNDFSRDQIHAMLFEEVVNSPETEYEKLLAFLNVNTSIRLPRSHGRPMAAPYHMTRIRIRRWLERPLKTWSRDGKYFEFKSDAASQIALKSVRFLDRMLLARLFASKRPRLNQDVLDKLQRYYHEDSESVEEWLGRPLGWRQS